MADFKKLAVWQKAMDLAILAMRMAQSLPREEQFALAQQIRRAAASVPANIAEGAGRGTDTDFRRFLDIARGSLYELETLLLIAHRMNYVADLGNTLELAAEVGRMINGLRQSLRPGSQSVRADD